MAVGRSGNKKPKKSSKPTRKKAGRKRSGPATVPRPLNVASPYPWAVTEALVRHLSDVQLRDLMRELLIDEAYRSGADVSKVQVNAETKAGDDGADGLTPAGRTSLQWLGDTETCWQFKAGAAGQAAKLKGEITKPIPARTLMAGGRFVLVASAAVDGPKGIAARKKQLVAEAKRGRLPTDRIEVLNSEALTIWINEHPAIASQLRGMPGGFASLEGWASHRTYRDPWVSSPALDANIEQVRLAVAFENPTPIVHLHVFGRPGIGKSRFVLQACQHASWNKSVLYVPQWAEADITSLLAAVAQAGAGRLVLVVDEVPPEQVKSLAFHAFAASDRIRVITIGHHKSPDGGTITEFEVQALDDETMARLIEAAHPTLPSEQVRYIVSFADGYTRLARLAANAVAKNADVHTADLLHHNGDIKQLMDSMLGQEDRRPLHVLAILSSVGWTGQRAEEGEAIAAHFGLDWMHVQASVERFHSRFGIAPRANDLRYISPAPLGVYLALDAVQSYPDKVRALFDKLPTDQAKRAYNERLAAILANPRAKAFGEEELSRFFHWSHFRDANAVDRWMTLSLANPVLAAGKVREALQQASDHERRQISNGARRKLVWSLVRLASYPDAFHDAAWTLAELAAAENETWANNASAEFVARYQLFLSGTACPYPDRLVVLDELLASGRPQLQALAVRALAQVGNGQEVGRVDHWTAPGPLPAQWRPPTNREYLACVLAALQRLERAAALPVPDEALINAAERLVIRLRNEPVRDSVAAFVRTAASKHPAIREHIRREIHRIAVDTRQIWKDRDEAAIAWIESLEKEFSDTTPRGRLRELVGPRDPDRTEESLRSLAEDLVANPDALWSEWPWLTSGQAFDAWFLGAALERADTKHDLLSQFLSMAGTGSDVSVIAGYVRSHAQTMPPEWIDDWLDQLERSSRPSPLILFDLTRRLTDTSRGAERITRMARANLLSQDAIAHLAFGPWVLGPGLPALRELFASLVVTPANHIHLLHMLDNRIQGHPRDLAGIEDLALELMREPGLLVSDSMSQYHWDKLARALLPQHAQPIARTIFAAQAKPNERSFFLEHSEASSTLDACIDADPQGVWEELAPLLTDEHQAKRFSIGFPHHVMGTMPRQPVLDWIAVDAVRRAPRIANITAKDFADSSLAAAILDRWGTQDDVKEQFFSAFVSGGWSGDASAHWEQLATYVEGIAKQTKLIGVRRWALTSAHELRRMAENDRKREAEARIRRYG